MKSLVLTAALETTAVVEPTLQPNPPIVRHVGAMRTPLDLRVIPFRYRVRKGRIEAVRTNCRHFTR
jgi:hypothetical protein